jgi:hypothetical protein
MVSNPRAEPWTLVFDAANRGIKPLPSRPPIRMPGRIKFIFPLHIRGCHSEGNVYWEIWYHLDLTSH